MRLAWLFIAVAVVPLTAQWWNTAGEPTVYTGGLYASLWSSDTPISDTSLSAGTSGVTLLLADYNYSIYEDGTVRAVTFSVQTDAGGAWQLKCYNTDFSSTFTYLTQTSTFTVPGTGAQTVTVSMTCPIANGNVLGIFVPHGSAIWAKAAHSTPWVSGNVTTISSLGGTASNAFPDLLISGDPPFIVGAGDSVEAGEAAYQPPFMSYLMGANVASQLLYQAQQAVSPSATSPFLYQNLGFTSTTCGNIDQNMATYTVSMKHAFLVHCGLADLEAGVTWTTGGHSGMGIQGDLNGILAQLPVGVHLFLNQVFPDSAYSPGSDILNLNANYATWAASNGVTMVNYFNAITCPSGTNALCSMYTGSFPHPNVSGYTLMGNVLASTMQGYYAPFVGSISSNAFQAGSVFSQ